MIVQQARQEGRGAARQEVQAEGQHGANARQGSTAGNRAEGTKAGGHVYPPAFNFYPPALLPSISAVLPPCLPALREALETVSKAELPDPHEAGLRGDPAKRLVVDLVA